MSKSVGPDLAPASAVPLAAAAASGQRIISLDQFRGYTLVGMFIVNFIGGFTVSSSLLKHHNTFCSYADTIMPHFLFAVGFAYRLSFGRRVLRQSATSAYLRVAKRLIGLALFGLFVFQFDGRLLPTYWFDLFSRGAHNEIWRPFDKDWTQTLFHIALTTLWVTPVIRASARWRVAYLLGSVALHVVLNHAFYFHWIYAPPITAHTGGPLGFLTWCVPTLVGTLACDGIASAVGRPRLGRMFAAAILLMGLGYLISCGTRWYDTPAAQLAALPPLATPGQADPKTGRTPTGEAKVAEHPVIPDSAAVTAWSAKLKRGEWSAVLAEPPFVMPPEPRFRDLNYWMMSVKTATLSFMTFNAGFSLFVYLLFYVACDLGGFQLGVLRTLGRNAMAGYLIQWPTDEIFTDLVERTSTAWGPRLGFPAEAIGRSAPVIFVAVAFVLFFAVNWLVLWIMEKKNIFLKV
jgi:hypothetical protein